MVMINRGTKEITLKIVYYGPGLCGKTTNLEHVYATANPDKKGKLLTVSTETDRTLFFDFLPVELGRIRGMKVRVQLYTVPGQVFYDATRRIVLRGSDGVVFVADAQKAMMDANVESVENLKTNLKLNNLDPETIPLVYQYNKQDLPDLSPVEELQGHLNWRDVPFFPSVATQGKGVNETLRKIIEQVIRRLQEQETAMRTSSKMRGPYELPEKEPPPKEAEETPRISAPPPPPPLPPEPPPPPPAPELPPAEEAPPKAEKAPEPAAPEIAVEVSEDVAEVVPVEEMAAVSPEDELEVIDLDAAPASARPKGEATSSLPTIEGDLPSGTLPTLTPVPEPPVPEAEATNARPGQAAGAAPAVPSQKVERLKAELEEARLSLLAITRTIAGLGEQTVRLSERLDALKKLIDQLSPGE